VRPWSNNLLTASQISQFLKISSARVGTSCCLQGLKSSLGGDFSHSLIDFSVSSETILLRRLKSKDKES
jgi:hypothetical protein